jgi:protein pelota
MHLIKCVVIGSPGFIKEAFANFWKSEASDRLNGTIKNILNKIILAHTSSGHKHSLTEIL